ncbi:MAG: carnitine dehydratase [Betaproteobacteria bacterium]|nr:carnitine dehydratase [Betaproteobacteria bacterium]
MSGPLNGIRVLDLTINVLGPLATQILGDMGADVIKIEAPDGDPMRHSGFSKNPGMASLFMNTNRNKRSVVLDLKRPAPREALMRLVETADVLVHSVRPQTAERLGVSYAAVSARNPRIVYAYGPGYRSDGPNRDRPAFDDVIQGESGIAAMIGRNGGEPRYMPMVMADKFCGHVLASAIGMALFSRERTSKGQEVVVPMLETMLSFNLVEHLWTNFFATDRENLGYSRIFSPHRRPYATRDGYICMLAISDDQWRRVFTVIGRPELARDERFAELKARTRNINELYAILAEEMKRKTTAEWQKLLDAADLPNGAVNELSAMAEDPYLDATGFFQHYEHPSEGAMVTTVIPVQFGETPGSIRLTPPGLGEHTQSVLQEIGYGQADIREVMNAHTAAAS